MINLFQFGLLLAWRTLKPSQQTWTSFWMCCEVSVLPWWHLFTLNFRSWCAYVEYEHQGPHQELYNNELNAAAFMLSESVAIKLTSKCLFTFCWLWCSFPHGASWRHWREGSTEPQSLYYHIERGTRDHTSWGKHSFLDLPTCERSWLIHWNNCLVLKEVGIWWCAYSVLCLFYRKWKHSLRVKIVQKP